MEPDRRASRIAGFGGYRIRPAQRRRAGSLSLGASRDRKFPDNCWWSLAITAHSSSPWWARPPRRPRSIRIAPPRSRVVARRADTSADETTLSGQSAPHQKPERGGRPLSLVSDRSFFESRLRGGIRLPVPPSTRFELHTALPQYAPDSVDTGIVDIPVLLQILPCVLPFGNPSGPHLLLPSAPSGSREGGGTTRPDRRLQQTRQTTLPVARPPAGHWNRALAEQSGGLWQTARLPRLQSSQQAGARG
jgi:hypothetical protein